ncbi:mitochondrial matrix Mmp37-domain-containing protein [Boletus reticuloceps]|uniref:Phosphatidate cytidylyltransferase, mitochondrial n=1 Tax=Boletus reticuloceps TaxID=495285 RepID=A0A8I3AEC7_9AGAM|nr:mitochondrial matrix Mmp37-domain-containing protein [Boletus reticuloceps]
MFSLYSIPYVRLLPNRSLTRPIMSPPAAAHPGRHQVSSVPNQRQTLPVHPPSFGRNQLLLVPNSTCALLQNIVNSFEAPIRYAFAYGSGVFEQAGYDKSAAVQAKGTDGPMLDFVFAVTHPDHWHLINCISTLVITHYTHVCLGLGRTLCRACRCLWFNTHVSMDGVMIKYGVTTVDTLCAGLLNWRTLYLAGRMHKPIRIIRDDARMRLTQQVNLASALRTALLMLPVQFTQHDLFSAIASISYAGDPRMLLPAENRGKVANMVARQEVQFRELYWRLT